MLNFVIFVVVVVIALYFMDVFNTDTFSNAGLYDHDLRVLQMAEEKDIPEKVLDFRNIPYHKYVLPRHKASDVNGHEIM